MSLYDESRRRSLCSLVLGRLRAMVGYIHNSFSWSASALALQSSTLLLTLSGDIGLRTGRKYGDGEKKKEGEIVQRFPIPLLTFLSAFLQSDPHCFLVGTKWGIEI